MAGKKFTVEKSFLAYGDSGAVLALSESIDQKSMIRNQVSAQLKQQ
jgi:hypothetical protein